MVVQWGAVLAAWLVGVWLQMQQADASQFRLAVLMLWGLPVVVLCWRWWAPAGWRRGWRAAGPLCVVSLSLGWAWTQWQAVERLSEQWPRAWQGQAVTLTGRVATMPQRQPWGQRFQVEVMSVEHEGQRWAGGEAWRLKGIAPGARCPRAISLTGPMDGPAQTLRPGEVWRWTARLSSPHALSNPGGFDAELWLFAQGLRAQGKIVTGADVPAPLLLRPVSWWSPGWLERWRMLLHDRAVSRVADPQVAGLIVGLTIGEQSAITPADWATLRDTGTAHLAAISGTHVTMMGWLVSVMVGWWWRRSWWRMHWLATPVASRLAAFAGALLYAFLSGWGVPAQRTVVMLAVVTLLTLSSRRWPWPLVLLLAAVVVTVLDPWALLQAGFWLSFAAVGLLMLSGAGERMPAGVPWHTRLRSSALTLWRTQWVAWLGLAPLSLVFFQQVSLVGLLANAVCIPLFTGVITPVAMLGLAVPSLWGLLAPLVHATMDALSWLAQWPWATVSGASVQAWAAALALVAGAWMVAPLPWRWRAMALPALLPLLWPTSWSQPLPGPPAGHLDVLAVDIGQGTAVLMRTARHAFLYDAGPRLSPDTDAGERVLVGMLRFLGVRQLDLLMVSHGDADHIGGAASVIKALSVKALSTSLPPGHELMAVADADGRRPSHAACQAGQSWTWDGVRFDVLHPTSENWTQRESISDNNMSCVVRARPEGSSHSLLLTGDIEKPQEAALVRRLGASLASEVLMVPHHGSRTSSTQAFLEAVKPELGVIQAGARNRYGHPHPKVVSRYEDCRIALIQTARCGAWGWSTAQGGARQAGWCWRHKARRYWQSRDMEESSSAHHLGP